MAAKHLGSIKRESTKGDPYSTPEVGFCNVTRSLPANATSGTSWTGYVQSPLPRACVKPIVLAISLIFDGLPLNRLSSGAMPPDSGSAASEGSLWKALIGWIAVAISISALEFWGYWGSIEAFYEGWYFRSFWMNLELTAIQYLAPVLVLMGAGIVCGLDTTFRGTPSLASGAGSRYRTPLRHARWPVTHSSSSDYPWPAVLVRPSAAPKMGDWCNLPTARGHHSGMRCPASIRRAPASR
jgi:hypothetical protein